MTTSKQSTKKGSRKSKAEGSEQRERDDALTAERIRAILSDPTTPEDVADKLSSMVNDFGEWTTCHIDETPDFFARAFYNAAGSVRDGNVIPEHELPEARTTLDAVTLFAERHEPEDARLARRVSELINSDEDGSDEVGEWFDQLTNDVGVSLWDAGFCAPAFVKAARAVRASKPVRRITTGNVMLHGAQKAYERLREIVRRVDAGETLAQIRDERKDGMREAGERHEAAEATKPEPKDKTSDAWRYWKIRQIEAGFESRNTEEYGAAWREFRRLFDVFFQSNSATVETAREILPGLLLGFQQAEGYKQRERRSETARKGAATRKQS